MVFIMTWLLGAKPTWRNLEYINSGVIAALNRAVEVAF